MVTYGYTFYGMCQICPEETLVCLLGHLHLVFLKDLFFIHYYILGFDKENYAIFSFNCFVIDIIGVNI